jgi:hypothetical protein
MRVIPGLLLVAVATIIAVVGLVLVQRLVSTERRKEHNDVAGLVLPLALIRPPSKKAFSRKLRCGFLHKPPARVARMVSGAHQAAW